MVRRDGASVTSSYGEIPAVDDRDAKSLRRHGISRGQGQQHHRADGEIATSSPCRRTSHVAYGTGSISVIGGEYGAAARGSELKRPASCATAGAAARASRPRPSARYRHAGTASM